MFFELLIQPLQLGFTKSILQFSIEIKSDINQYNVNFDFIFRNNDIVLIYPRVFLCPSLCPLRLPYEIQEHISHLMLLRERLISIIASYVMIVPYTYNRCLIYKSRIHWVISRHIKS